MKLPGLSVGDASALVAAATGGRRCRVAEGAHVVRARSLGEFSLRLDWDHLHSRANLEPVTTPGFDWTEAVRLLLGRQVPVKLTCPRLPLGQLHKLAPMGRALLDTEPMQQPPGTGAASRVSIGAELPRLDAETLHRYLRAFCLLQWWLNGESGSEENSRSSRIIGDYPEAYLHSIHALPEPSMAQLTDHYLEHNPTSERALDMLPVFALFNARRVLEDTPDERVRAGPALRYSSLIAGGEADRSLAAIWNRWCVVERLASDPTALDTLAGEFCVESRAPLGVPRRQWTARIDRWLMTNSSHT